jgi:hypothetical protein
VSQQVITPNKAGGEEITQNDLQDGESGKKAQED